MNQPILPQTGVDPWPEIIHLLPQKVTFQGQPVSGDATTLKGFGGWLMQQMPAVVGSGDADSRAGSFLLWLRSEATYEADPAARMAAAAQVQTAPANPISTQTVPQQAQLAPAPAAAAPAAAPATAGAAPAAAEEAEAGPGMTCPECQQKVSGMRGFKRHVTMTHKTDWPAFCSKFGLDQKTGLAGGAAPAPVAPAVVPPPPTAAPVPPMFQANGPAQPFAAPAPPPPPGTPVQPVSMPQPAPMVAAAPSMPMTGMAPPTQIPTHAPGPMVAFNPAAPAPAPLIIQPGLPGQQQVPFQQPQAAPQIQAAPVQVGPSFGGPSRDDLAKMLGGAVDLVIVRLLDAAAVPQLLQGRVDVNQIAAVAESYARSEMKVADLAQASYGQGKQAAQRHFGELLTKAPGCYMLLNGYDPIIPDGYLQILAARVTKFHIVTDGGRQTTTIF